MSRLFVFGFRRCYAQWSAVGAIRPAAAGSFTTRRKVTRWINASTWRTHSTANAVSNNWYCTQFDFLLNLSQIVASFVAKSARPTSPREETVHKVPHYQMTRQTAQRSSIQTMSRRPSFARWMRQPVIAEPVRKTAAGVPAKVNGGSPLVTWASRVTGTHPRWTAPWKKKRKVGRWGDGRWRAAAAL